MDTQRLNNLLREAGADLDASDLPTAETLTELATRAIDLFGFEAEELERVSESLQSTSKTSALAAGIGTGLSAFTLVNAAPLLDVAVDAGARLSEFLTNHHDLLTAGWDALAPPVAKIVAEAILHLPGGTLDLSTAFAEAGHIAHELISAALSEGGTLGEVVDALTIAADAVDLADIATTFGLSLFLGLVAGKIVSDYYKPKIEDLKARVLRIQQHQTGLENLKRALELKLPANIIAVLLENVAPHHWGL